MIRIKRIYDPAEPEDGERILVDRIWPRGVRKEEAALDHWYKDLAPSTQLRKWFGHDPEKWPTFKQRYRAELEAGPKAALLRKVAEKADKHTLTLLYAARDTEHNNAMALKDFIET